MKRILILLFLIAIFNDCCGQNNNPKKKQIGIIALDTTIALMPFEKDNYGVLKNNKSTKLNYKELQMVTELLSKCIKQRNSEFTLKNNIELKKYYKQYVATINSKGEKEVWVNCFCYLWDTEWRKNLIRVADGGKCYFNVKINLSRQIYYELIINGEG
ncbi:hypothetical protein [Flavobacterium sp.]|uniref:hypothetical protein n=1 Tax=Flavobacterium sp. TaxID=239 RepID=UPI00286E0EEF|nr:hypothetical protein [Flavobacterium sp.]